MKNILSILLRKHPRAPSPRPMIVPAPGASKADNQKQKQFVLFLVFLITVGGIGYFEFVYFKNDSLTTGGHSSLNQQGIQLLQSGNYEGAIAQFEAELKNDPRSISTRLNLAYAFKALKQFSKAEKIYTEILRENTQNALAHNNYGVFLSEQKRFSEAETQFQSAMNLDRNYLEATLNLAITQENARKFAEAIQTYNTALVMENLEHDLAQKLSERVRVLHAVARSKENQEEKL